jgi:hypothetical protein
MPQLVPSVERNTPQTPPNVEPEAQDSDNASGWQKAAAHCAPAARPRGYVPVRTAPLET